MVEAAARRVADEAVAASPEGHGHSLRHQIWLTIDYARHKAVRVDEAARIVAPVIDRESDPDLFRWTDLLMYRLGRADIDYPDSVPELEARAQSIIDPDD